MKWNLTKEENGVRTYTQDQTGTICQTSIIHTDKAGRAWYGFIDLFSIPYMRIAFSQQISSLFKVGLTSQDLKKWVGDLKSLVRAKDAEKYEKVYKSLLDIEVMIDNTVDPLKQHLALATIYVLYPDERIDSFNYQECEKKLQDWALYPESTAFFLNWHTEAIQSYMNNLNSLSQIALNLPS